MPWLDERRGRPVVKSGRRGACLLCGSVKTSAAPSAARAAPPPTARVTEEPSAREATASLAATAGPAVRAAWRAAEPASRAAAAEGWRLVGALEGAQLARAVTFRVRAPVDACTLGEHATDN
jgi:hypothetical protein